MIKCRLISAEPFFLIRVSVLGRAKWIDMRERLDGNCVVNMVDLSSLSFVSRNITFGFLNSKVDNRFDDGLFINGTNWGGW